MASNKKMTPGEFLAAEIELSEMEGLHGLLLAAAPKAAPMPAIAEFIAQWKAWAAKHDLPADPYEYGQAFLGADDGPLARFDRKAVQS